MNKSVQIMPTTRKQTPIPEEDTVGQIDSQIQTTHKRFSTRTTWMQSLGIQMVQKIE